MADRRVGEDRRQLQVCQVQSWCPVEDDRRILGKERSDYRLALVWLHGRNSALKTNYPETNS